MSDLPPNYPPTSFSLSESCTSPIYVNCAPETENFIPHTSPSENLQSKKSRSSSIGSQKGNKRMPQSDISVDPMAPGDVQFDLSNLSAGFDKSFPQYTTTSKNAAGPFIPSRENNHNRLPSLGVIHQSVEEEQEAQVNRLLQMIHTEQQNLWHLRHTNEQLSSQTPTDEIVPTSQCRTSLSSVRSSQNIPRSIDTRVPCTSTDNNDCLDLQRQNSMTSRKTISPGPATAIDCKEDGESFSWCFRDDPSFYQAETQMMTRENQMLRKRIKELELQISQLSTDL